MDVVIQLRLSLDKYTVLIVLFYGCLYRCLNCSELNTLDKCFTTIERILQEKSDNDQEQINYIRKHDNIGRDFAYGLVVILGAIQEPPRFYHSDRLYNKLYTLFPDSNTIHIAQWIVNRSEELQWYYNMEKNSPITELNKNQLKLLRKDIDNIPLFLFYIGIMQVTENRFIENYIKAFNFLKDQTHIFQFIKKYKINSAVFDLLAKGQRSIIKKNITVSRTESVFRVPTLPYTQQPIIRHGSSKRVAFSIDTEVVANKRRRICEDRLPSVENIPPFNIHSPTSSIIEDRTSPPIPSHSSSSYIISPPPSNTTNGTTVILPRKHPTDTTTLSPLITILAAVYSKYQYTSAGNDLLYNLLWELIKPYIITESTEDIHVKFSSSEFQNKVDAFGVAIWSIIKKILGNMEKLHGESLKFYNRVVEIKNGSVCIRDGNEQNMYYVEAIRAVIKDIILFTRNDLPGWKHDDIYNQYIAFVLTVIKRYHNKQTATPNDMIELILYAIIFGKFSKSEDLKNAIDSSKPLPPLFRLCESAIPLQTKHKFNSTYAPGIETVTQFLDIIDNMTDV